MGRRRGSDSNYARAHPSTAEEMEIRRVLMDMDLAVFGDYETPIGGPPSEEELADIEGYCAVATPGPWHWTTDALNGEPYKGRRPRRSILVYQLQGAPRRDKFENEVLTLNWGQLRGASSAFPPRMTRRSSPSLARTCLDWSLRCAGCGTHWMRAAMRGRGHERREGADHA
jgi:hypothetical protein